MSISVLAWLRGRTHGKGMRSWSLGRWSQSGLVINQLLNLSVRRAESKTRRAAHSVLNRATFPNSAKAGGHKASRDDLSLHSWAAKGRRKRNGSRLNCNGRHLLLLVALLKEGRQTANSAVLKKKHKNDSRRNVINVQPL